LWLLLLLLLVVCLLRLLLLLFMLLVMVLRLLVILRLLVMLLELLPAHGLLKARWFIKRILKMRRWPLLSVEMIIEVRRSLEMMRWRRLSLMMVGGRGWSIVSSDLWHYRFVTPLHEDGDVPDIAGRFAGRLGTLLLLIVLWRDIDAGHESLTLTRLRGLLLLTLTLQLLLLLLPVLRRRRHRALTAFALLRAYLHVVAPLLLAYVHGVT
jgi:hypothetical protein